MIKYQRHVFTSSNAAWYPLKMHERITLITIIVPSTAWFYLVYFLTVPSHRFMLIRGLSLSCECHLHHSNKNLLLLTWVASHEIPVLMQTSRLDHISGMLSSSSRKKKRYWGVISIGISLNDITCWTRPTCLYLVTKQNKCTLESLVVQTPSALVYGFVE